MSTCDIVFRGTLTRFQNEVPRLLTKLGTLWSTHSTSLCVGCLILRTSIADTLPLDWYYIAFPKDRWLPKVLVYSIFILDTVQTIMVTDDVYNAYARNFGNVSTVDAVENEWHFHQHR